jgi:hypothetical protein
MSVCFIGCKQSSPKWLDALSTSMKATGHLSAVVSREDTYLNCTLWVF